MLTDRDKLGIIKTIVSNYYAVVAKGKAPESFAVGTLNAIQAIMLFDDAPRDPTNGEIAGGDDA